MKQLKYDEVIAAHTSAEATFVHELTSFYWFVVLISWQVLIRR